MLVETIEVFEQHISGSDAAIEATAERGRRRLGRSKKRESELEAVVLKTQQQQQRDASATGELSAAARLEVPNLHQELASASSNHAGAMAKAEAEIGRLTTLKRNSSAALHTAEVWTRRLRRTTTQGPRRSRRL